MKLFNITEEVCDWYVPIFGHDLFIFKPDPFIKGGDNYGRGHWGIGRSYGDGVLALRTPWFMLYLE